MRNLIGCPVTATEVSAGKNELRTNRRELNCDLFTDARGRAGNDNALACHGTILDQWDVHAALLKALGFIARARF
jgi:hypothetical protein